MKVLVYGILNYFLIANLFHLILINYLFILIIILMTGSALTLKLVLHHDELKNVNHVVLRGALVEQTSPTLVFKKFLW